MSLQLPFGLNPVNKMANVDERYGPYPSVSDALATLSDENNTREIGLTVGIIESGDVFEYWFKSSIEDAGLVPKSAEAIIASAVLYIPQTLTDEQKEQVLINLGITEGIQRTKVSEVFIYDGENNVFDIGEPVAQILDVMIGNGANFDDTVVGFTPGDSEIEINSEDLLEGMKIKFLYI